MPRGPALMLISVLVLVCIASGSSLDMHDKGCPQNWVRHHQSCYTMYAHSLYDWDQARLVCQQQGGHLAVPNSPGENDFMWRMLNDAIERSNPNRIIWLGCTYMSDNGRVECIGEEKSEYNNLNPGNHLTQPGCFVLKYRLGVWDLYNCTGGRPFICERTRCRTPTRCQAVPRMDSSPHAQPRCLLGHAFKETVMTSPVQCCLACSVDPKCRSFNLSGRMCQLNNITASEVDADKYFMPLVDCAYYEYI
ncbi:snaclec GPIB-binding protein subunit alpha-like [Patiria miniata]|uniref:C-type lectin domain-containing protein n=1 Tax=Patiria miniata TaxID=46514 RepID=A0A913Z5X1_PATMI|nr:snaclec GPIB-binding protein subunit alpha-like [Patiria miniata]